MHAADVAGLHHAGLYVASLDRSLNFYADVFGLEVAEQFMFEGERLAFLRVGDQRLELIESTKKSTVPRAAGVVDHVALEVRDLEGWLARLRQHGVVLLDSSPVTVAPLGARIVFYLGPDGERIELLER